MQRRVEISEENEELNLLSLEWEPLRLSPSLLKRAPPAYSDDHYYTDVNNRQQSFSALSTTGFLSSPPRRRQPSPERRSTFSEGSSAMFAVDKHRDLSRLPTGASYSYGTGHIDDVGLVVRQQLAEDLRPPVAMAAYYAHATSTVPTTILNSPVQRKPLFIFQQQTSSSPSNNSKLNSTTNNSYFNTITATGPSRFSWSDKLHIDFMSAIWRVGLNHALAKNLPTTLCGTKHATEDTLKDSTNEVTFCCKPRGEKNKNKGHQQGKFNKADRNTCNSTLSTSSIHQHLEYFQRHQIEAEETVTKLLLEQDQKRGEQHREDHKENRPLAAKDHWSTTESESIFSADHLLVKNGLKEEQQAAPLFIAVVAQLVIMCVTGGEPDKMNRCISPVKTENFHFPSLSLDQCHQPLGKGMGCIMGLLNCFKQVIDDHQHKIKKQHLILTQQLKPSDSNGNIIEQEQTTTSKHDTQPIKRLQSLQARHRSGDDNDNTHVDPSIVIHEVTKTAFLAGSKIGLAFNLVKRGDESTNSMFSAALLKQNTNNTDIEDNISSLAVKSQKYSGAVQQYPLLPVIQNLNKRKRTEDRSCDYNDSI